MMSASRVSALKVTYRYCLVRCLLESKLLKTGTTYGLGRKGCPLIVANKKVSSHHCDFEVKDFSVDDAVWLKMYLPRFEQ